jgi:hypothetical protein
MEEIPTCWAGGVVQVEECLPTKPEFKPQHHKKKKGKKKEIHTQKWYL